MGAVFALFAGFYYWTPKIVGRSINDFLGKIHFWTLFTGVRSYNFVQDKNKLKKSSTLSNIKLFKLNKKISSLNYSKSCLRFYSNNSSSSNNKLN